MRLNALEVARFTVMDIDTEELLIRSFVRNDGVWKQPKVMGAMVSGAQEISSRKLRLALLAEMDRIPLDDLSDEPTKVRNVKGPSIRQQVTEHISALRRAFEGLDPEPPSTSPIGGYEGASVPPSASPSDTPADGGREASTRADACACPPPQAQAAPVPCPCPLPLSPAPAPAPSSSPAWAAADPEADPTDWRGGGGDQDDNPTEAAIAFLENLPAPWTVGHVTAKAIAPNLLDRIQERRWQLDAELATELTKNPIGINNHREVLRVRIADLAYRLHAVPANRPARPCTACGAAGGTLTDNGLCLPCSTGGVGQRAPRPDSLRKPNPKTA